MTSKINLRSSKKREQGISLLETMIAVFVLMYGLLAVLATFALAISSTQNVNLDAIARQKAQEAMESVFTARETNQISFSQIYNVGQGNGIFTPGFTPLTDPGPDGLDGTADDVAAAPVILPGPSGTITGQSPPDVTINLANFQRQIQIADVPSNPNLRQITITIKYPTPQGWVRQYQLQALVSSFR
jgi:type II secretory pathway pseudopilin PulG